MLFQPGGNQGIARGSIVIDTSGVVAARQIVVTASQQMTTAFNQVGTAIDRNMGIAGTSARALGQGYREARGEILAVGAATSTIVVGGLRAADSVQQINIRLRAITGSQEEANRLMAEAAQIAQRLNQPVTAVQRTVASILPYVEDTGEGLETWVDLITRVQSLNPAEGFEGALFAVRELISSGGTDAVSLAERFNLPRTALKSAIADSGLAAGLDQILNQMGVTTESAAEMGNTLSGAAARAGDAFNRALGTGLSPFLGTVTSIVEAGGNFLSWAQQSYPLLLQIGGGFSVATAGGLAFVAMAGQIITSLETIRKVSPGTIAAMGRGARVAGAGVAGFLGVEAGIGIARMIDPSLGSQDEARDQLGQRVGQIVAILVHAIGEVAVAFQTGQYIVDNAFTLIGGAIELGGLAVSAAFWNAADAIGEFVSNLGEQLGNEAIQQFGESMQQGAQDALGERGTRGGFGELTRSAGTGIYGRMGVLEDRMGQGVELTSDQQGTLNTIRSAYSNAVLTISETLGLIPPRAEEVTDSLGQTANAMGQFSQDQLDAFGEYQDQLSEISANEYEARQEQLAAHEERKTETEASYQLTRERMLEDIGIANRRAEQALGRQIEGIVNQRIETIASSEEQRDARIAEIREKGEKALEEQQAEFNLRRQRQQEEDQLAMLVAASTLDASAIWRLQQGQQLRESQQDQDFAIAQQRRREQLDEQLQAEHDAHNQRVANAYAAERQQIAAQQESFALQQQIEAEDRELRFARMAEDHQRQLDALDAQNEERLDQIEQQAQDERNLLRSEFIETYNALAKDAGQHQSNMINIQRAGQAQLEAELRAWLIRQQNAIRASAPSTTPTYTNPNTTVHRQGQTAYADGTTFVPMTGSYTLHESEMVLKPSVSDALRYMLGQGVSQEGILAAASAGVSGRGGNSSSFAWHGDLIMPPVPDGSTPGQMYGIALQAMKDFFSMPPVPTGAGA